MRQRAKQTVVISRHVETEPQEAHNGKKETYFDLTCSSTVLTVHPITLFLTETIQPWGSSRFFHYTSQSGFATYGMPHLWVRLGSGLWVGLGLGLKLELPVLMAFVVWCEKSIAKKYWYRYLQYFSVAVLVLLSVILFAKVLVLVLAILFTSIVNNPAHTHSSESTSASAAIVDSVTWPDLRSPCSSRQLSSATAACAALGRKFQFRDTYSTSIDPIVVSVTVFEIFDV